MHTNSGFSCNSCWVPVLSAWVFVARWVRWILVSNSFGTESLPTLHGSSYFFQCCNQRILSRTLKFILLNLLQPDPNPGQSYLLQLGVSSSTLAFAAWHILPFHPLAWGSQPVYGIALETASNNISSLKAQHPSMAMIFFWWAKLIKCVAKLTSVHHVGISIFGEKKKHVSNFSSFDTHRRFGAWIHGPKTHGFFFRFCEATVKNQFPNFPWRWKNKRHLGWKLDWYSRQFFCICNDMTSLARSSGIERPLGTAVEISLNGYIKPYS